MQHQFIFEDAETKLINRLKAKFAAVDNWFWDLNLKFYKIDIFQNKIKNHEHSFGNSARKNNKQSH